MNSDEVNWLLQTIEDPENAKRFAQTQYQCGRIPYHVMASLARDRNWTDWPAVEKPAALISMECITTRQKILAATASEARTINMLKITITETETETRWILQGTLVGPWVRELRSCWKKRHRTQTGKGCVVDLNDVTFIDKSGQRLLRAMSKKGAQLVANGVYTKHVVDVAKTKGKRGLVP